MSLPNRYFAAVLMCLAFWCATHNTLVAQQVIGQRLMNRLQGKAKVESANFIVYANDRIMACLLYTSPSPRDLSTSRMPSSA